MDVIIVLIFISLSIAVCFLILFIWNVRSGQYDDTVTPSIRILFGDKRKKSKEGEADFVLKRKE
jgi:cbb3-type cytochrome oxidase maturation protein